MGASTALIAQGALARDATSAGSIMRLHPLLMGLGPSPVALSLGECKRVVRWIGRPCACARLGSRASQGLAFSLMISLGFWMYNYEVGASKASKASRVPINPAGPARGVDRHPREPAEDPRLLSSLRGRVGLPTARGRAAETLHFELSEKGA